MRVRRAKKKGVNVSDGATLVDESDVNYAERVGERLRAVRKRRRLSLQAVETQSEQEFKASVLGAYERGERAISVPRLQRLARFYGVSVDQLLPEDEDLQCVLVWHWLFSQSLSHRRRGESRHGRTVHCHH